MMIIITYGLNITKLIQLYTAYIKRTTTKIYLPSNGVSLMDEYMCRLNN